MALRIRSYFAEERNGDDYSHFGVHTSFASAFERAFYFHGLIFPFVHISEPLKSFF